MTRATANAIALVGGVLGLAWLGLSLVVVLDPRAVGVSSSTTVGAVAIGWLLVLTLVGVATLVLATSGWLISLRTGNRRWRRRGLLAVPCVFLLFAIWVLTAASYGGS